MTKPPRTLISLLGKSQLDSRTGYRTARYRMPDGSEHETAYFGLALAQHLAVERMLLLGTPTSMWDLFVEHVAGDDAAEDARLRLFDAVRTGTLTPELLESLTPAISQKLGRPVACLLIPPSVSFAEQQQVLAQLAECLPPGERVAFDITHGYRHLAMLGLAAARYLAHSRQVTVTGLYYGALEMTAEGLTPVVTLDGLAHLQEWSEVFEAYAASGDFARFAALLERDGFPAEAARALERAWQFLQISNVSDAARALQPAWQALPGTLDWRLGTLSHASAQGFTLVPSRTDVRKITSACPAKPGAGGHPARCDIWARERACARGGGQRRHPPPLRATQSG